jgi:diguanylate cyclase (GGDEF)-like protein
MSGKPLPASAQLTPRDVKKKSIVGPSARQLRLSRGESVNAVAQRAGLSAIHLARLEAGNIQPTEDVIRRLAQALAVPVGVLFGEQSLTAFPLGEFVLHEQEKLLAHLRSLLNRDRVTGAYTFTETLQVLTQELSHAQRIGEPLSILLLEIEHFHQLTDTHGQAGIDIILGSVAERMRETLRVYDKICRLSPQTFLIVLPACSRQAAQRAAERLRVALTELPYSVFDRDVLVTASFGIAENSKGLGDAQALLRAAKEDLAKAMRAPGEHGKAERGTLAKRRGREQY